MRYISFGRKNVQVSEVVAGLMRIPQLSIPELEVLVETCLEEGINAFDLADIYGGGKCEALVGELLAARPDLWDKMWIQSKCGIHSDGFNYFDFSKEHILNSVDGILSRLQTDHLDSLLLHRPDALMEPEEVAEAFDILEAQGKVLEFGVSNQNPSQMELLKKCVKQPLAANQLQLSAAFTPSLDEGFNVNMQIEPGIVRGAGAFEYCRLHDIVIQAWSSLQHGYFQGVFFGAPGYEKLNEKIDQLAAQKGVTNTAVALAWILRYPGKTQAVIGTTKPERIRESAHACDFTLTRKEWYVIYLAAGNRLP